MPAHERRHEQRVRTRRSPTTSRLPAPRPRRRGGAAARPIEYTASGKWTVLRKKEKPAAEIFSVAYVAGDGDGARPVTFVFNGGPGASSAFLHMGAVGPQRVDFPSDGTLPTVPAKLVENESSWLAFSDLVFVDPVGTGFSRVIEPEKKDDGKEGAQAGRRPRPEGVLRVQARPRVPLRVHGPLALRERSLGLTRLHRRRELRRLPRRSPRADAPGDGGHRAERRDPHLTRSRDHRPRPDRLRRARLGRPRTDDGRGCVSPRSLARVPQEHVAREGLPRRRGLRDRRLRVVPHARRVHTGEGAHADPHAPR